MHRVFFLLPLRAERQDRETLHQQQENLMTAEEVVHGPAITGAEPIHLANMDGGNQTGTSTSTSTNAIGLSNSFDDSTRDAEKKQALTKQREKYMSIEASVRRESQGGFVHRMKMIWNAMFSDVDTHNEHLYYLLLIELFFIFLTYTHYPYFDKKNKFLTPIVMGGETSLLGETVTQLRKCIMKKKTFHRAILSNDEEKSLQHLSLDTRRVTNTGMHSRSSSNVDKLASPLLSPTLSGNVRGHNRNISRSLDLRDSNVQDDSLRDHLKYLMWGGLNGLLSSYWIDLVITLFPTKRYACVLLDQTIGTVIFQTLYTLFICIWDAEVEVISKSYSNGTLNSKGKVELTWDAFVRNYASMLWKYMKISWMIWPFVSIISFTLLPHEWIFPVNCISATIFTVLLGM